MSNIKINDEQLKQMQNISSTLVEATEHFTKHIREREFTQSIHIFSSIVEGFEAIKKMHTLYDMSSIDLVDNLNKIERSLVMIVEQLEQNNLTKITEMIQFSLMPNLRNVHKALTKNEVNKETITIGVYYDKINPREVYTEERVHALVQEGHKQNVKLIFFSSDNINFEEQKIEADAYVNGQWQKVTSSFPDVINNIGARAKHQQSITERRLRRQIPFTSFGVGNKFYLPKLMVKHRRFAELLVPFRMVTDEQIVYNYLKEEKIAVLKPILGARGESIFFVQKKGSRFVVTEHRQERIYNREKFHEWIQHVLLKRKFSYMIQRYVECQTKDGEPYDIRAHMQKDKHGKWTITKIYPRIGSKQSILSNISRGGRTEALDTLLVKEFGKDEGEKYNKDLQNLSMDLTKYLDRIHNFSLDEIGLDLAIDHSGRFWLHEANNGPQSTYHEEVRAVHTIGYAIYIAENGIVKHGHFQEPKNQFNAKTSRLPFAEIDNRYRIGMLKTKDDDEKLAVACAYVAHYENVNFYTFTPNDIDYNEMLIKGHFFEKGKWVSKIVEYPDVIYDRYRLKGIKGHNTAYEELDGIPFTNEFYGNSISKLQVYDKLKSSGELDDVIIPYKKVEKVRDILEFINVYGAVIVKPEIGSFARGVHYISEQRYNTYFVAERDQEIELSEVELRKHINELLDTGTFIVQQYISTRTVDGQPFDIRVHMMKDGNNEWDFASIYPRIGVRYATISSTGSGGYVGGLHGFIKRNFSKNSSSSIKKTIKSLSVVIAKKFSSFYAERFNEMALDLALDPNGHPYLIEINVNKPGIIDEFEIAQLSIPNAVYIADKTLR